MNCAIVLLKINYYLELLLFIIYYFTLNDLIYKILPFV